MEVFWENSDSFVGDMLGVSFPHFDIKESQEVRSCKQLNSYRTRLQYSILWEIEIAVCFVQVQANIVPFSNEHDGTAQGGKIPSGSSPASLSNNATTPCGGTLVAVKLRIAVPFSVWVHRSC